MLPVSVCVAMSDEGDEEAEEELGPYLGVSTTDIGLIISSVYYQPASLGCYRCLSLRVAPCLFDMTLKKVNVAHTRLPSVGFRS